MAKFNNEMKTGIVVLVAVLLLLYLMLKMGGVKISEGYELNVLFDYVSGLEEKAPVKLAGVAIGEVKKVAHTYNDDETKVLVVLAIDKCAKIREDSKIRISTTGLIGEKYIEITGGSKGSPVVAKGRTLVGIDPFEMEELIEMGKSLASRLDSTMQDLQKLMNNANGVLSDNREDLRATIVNLKDTSENFKEFSDEIKRNPWKLLIKGKEVRPDSAAKEQKKGEKKCRTNF